MVLLAVSLGLMGCSNKKKGTEATVLPPPPPLESEPMPASLSAAPTPIAPAPAPAAQQQPVWNESAPYTPAPVAGGRTYRVQRGDTLMGIARREYNDAGMWRKIAEANGLSNPNVIKVGQELVLP